MVIVKQMLALNVGVRRPFSILNGSGTKVTAFANSKPLNYVTGKKAKVQTVTVKAVSIIIAEEGIV